MTPDQISVVLLAGGRGTRAGAPKGLVDVLGRPWITCQLEALGRAGLKRAVVVLGEEPQRYFDAIPWMSAARNGFACALGTLEAKVVLNPAPVLGPFSSLVCGLRWLFEADSPQPVFVLPIDVPCPGEQVWRGLARELGSQSVLAATPDFEGRGGHPILLSASLAEKISRLNPEFPGARLDLQLRALPESAVARLVTNDERVRMNLNTPEEWQVYAGQLRADKP